MQINDNFKKTVLVLGGGLNQISLFEAARELGYRTILCDAKDNTVCKALSDLFIQVDISEPSKILSAISDIDIDGIVCNTESLMGCLSVVQNKLQLIGNKPSSIELLVDKYLFRKIEKEAGLFAPQISRV